MDRFGYAKFRKFAISLWSRFELARTFVGYLASRFSNSISISVDGSSLQSWTGPSRILICLMLLQTFLLSSCADDVESRVLALTEVVTTEANVNVQEKIAEYHELVRANPSDADAVGNLGVIYEIHGFSKEALAAYELSSLLAPEEFRWIYYRAILLAARFNREQAIEVFDQAIAKRPDYGPVWIQKGKVLLDSGRYAEASSSFKRAEQLTDDPYALLGQAFAKLELDEPLETIALLDRLGELADEVNVKRLRGNALVRLGRTKEGTELLGDLPRGESISWEDPVAEEKWRHAADHFNARLVKVVQLIRAQEYESALFVLADLRAESPQNKHVLHLLSSVYELRGDNAAALRTLEEGIQLYPDFYVFRTAAASFLSARGNLAEAVRQLDAAIEIDPNLHWAYVQKARLLMEQKKWLEASQLLDQAIGIRNDDADLYTYLGICMSFMDRWPEAASLFRTALSIDSKHVPSYINLARAETILDNEAEAIRALEAAKTLGADPKLVASIELQRERIKQMRITTVER